MTTLVDYKSPEKDILINVLKEYSSGHGITCKAIPLLDSLNISSIIENMIYEEVKEYYENGSLKCKYTLRFGKKDGLYQDWFYNEQRREECHYRDGKRDGMYQRWYRGADNSISDRENGQKEIECYYRDGNLDGLFQRWHSNGQKWEKYYYRDGKRDGMYQRWYRGADNSISDRENGQKEVECYYRAGDPATDGNLDGLFQRWHSNGQKWEEYYYRDGKKEGLMREP